MGNGNLGRERTEVPEIGSEAPRPDPSSRTDRAARQTSGWRGLSRMPLTWSSKNSNRWVLKLSIWKSHFCIKPSKLPSSTSTRSPSSRPWPSRSQPRALGTAEGRSAGRKPQSSRQKMGRQQAALGRAKQLQRSPRPGALPLGPSGRETGAHTRGAAARRARGSGSPRRTQLEPPAPVRLQGAGRGAAGRARSGREGARPGHKGGETTWRGRWALRSEQVRLAL